MFKKFIKKRPIIFSLVGYFTLAWGVAKVIDVFVANFNLPEWVFPVYIIFMLAGFLIALAIMLLSRLFNQRLYIDAQIEGCSKAKKTIFFSIHSLNPIGTNKKYKLFNESLNEAINRGVIVKVLAPGGVDRAQGAYELSEQFGIPIKFAMQLEDEDLRFTLIDELEVMLSYQKIPSKKLSKVFAKIESRNLNRILTSYFLSIWNSKSSFSFQEYILSLCEDLSITNNISSIKRCSKRIGVPTHVIKRILSNESLILKDSQRINLN